MLSFGKMVLAASLHATSEQLPALLQESQLAFVASRQSGSSAPHPQSQTSSQNTSSEHVHSLGTWTLHCELSFARTRSQCH